MRQGQSDDKAAVRNKLSRLDYNRMNPCWDAPSSKAFLLRRSKLWRAAMKRESTGN
jgi:hypothetical protein